MFVNFFKIHLIKKVLNGSKTHAFAVAGDFGKET